MKTNQDRSIPDFLVPSYGELSLFLITLALLLTILFVPEVGNAVYFFFIKNFQWGYFPFYVVAILFASRMVYSVRHVFTKRQKTQKEKSAMLYTAVLTNGFSGVLAGMFLIDSVQRILWVFPIWNIVTSMFLMVLYYVGALDESKILDENTSLPQVAVGATVIAIIFLICRTALDLHWSATLSICVTYASSIDEDFRKGLSQCFSSKPEA